ncbi:Pentatricopeptide repeat-containing protein mitochondrial [Spatholobus suberectus]|nr:Pentatricopeptide repeat-containing protein mitochondrial [Spatholobus suberectus]
MRSIGRRQFSTLVEPPHKTASTKPFVGPTPLPIPHRTIPEARGQDLDFITVARSHVIHSRWDKLHPLSTSLTPFRLKHLLLALQNDPVLSLHLSTWVLHHTPSSHTLDSRAILLHTLAKHRRFKTTQTLLAQILSSHLPSTLFESLLRTFRLCRDSSPLVFDALFKTLAHTNKLRHATHTYVLMKEHGFSPTVESCNAFLSSSLRLRRADIALAFYREMRRACVTRVSPNVYTLNMVIRARCMSGEVQKGFEMFQKMRDMGLSPNVVSFNTLISGYCNKGLFGLALRVKSLMGENGVQPNVVTFNALINGFCKERKLHEANRVFSEMKVANVVPSVVTYNTLLNGYGQVGDSEMGIRVYEEMVRNGVKADILTYNALILGLCKDGKTKKAAGFVRELDKENLVPNASTFSALITGQCVRNNSERAFLIYRSMVRSGCSPNEHTFQMLISAFCKNEDFDGAVQVLRDMLGRLMSPDSSTLYELCVGLCRCGRDQLALQLCSEMEARRLLPEGFDKEKIAITHPENETGN